MKEQDLKTIMDPYFRSNEDKHDRSLMVESVFLQNFNPHFDKPPVNVASVSWEVVESPRRLMKRFEFDDSNALKAFVVEVLDYQEQVHHHGKLTIQPDEVFAEIYTHTVDDVTSMDKEWADMVDSIYEDVKYFSPVPDSEDGFYE